MQFADGGTNFPTRKFKSVPVSELRSPILVSLHRRYQSSELRYWRVSAGGPEGRPLPTVTAGSQQARRGCTHRAGSAGGPIWLVKSTAHVLRPRRRWRVRGAGAGRPDRSRESQRLRLAIMLRWPGLGPGLAEADSAGPTAGAGPPACN